MSTGTVEAENKLLVRRLALNKHNADALDDLLAADFVNHDPLPGSTPDREGYKQSLGQLVNALPDLTVSIEDIVAEGDRVAVRVIERGTQRGRSSASLQRTGW